MEQDSGPFHPGEIEAQRRADVLKDAAATGSFIRGHMPDQHRDFFTRLPFLVVAAGDAEGRPWVSILEGPEGFVTSPDAHELRVASSLPPEDPLAAALRTGREIGILGIELATRRRNRLNGTVREAGDGFAIEVRQSFGNCPQYIRERNWRWGGGTSAGPATVSDRLNAEQQRRIMTADTFFIGSGQSSGQGRATDGFDASHRGGEPGFVRIAEDGWLNIPDYAGNKYFNTIGNLLRNPKVGLLFVDFRTGGMLHLTGRATIEWDVTNAHDPLAQRMIVVEVDKVVDRPAALSLRWEENETGRVRLKVVDKVRQSGGIMSVELADADGGDLAPFRAGEHLPISLTIPGQAGRVRRNYSLSGPPGAGTYRLAIKREGRGVASSFLHDVVGVGDTIEAGRPSGDFVLPEGDGPVVLVSAGVGITPVLSMLHALVAEQPARPVWFVHAARNSGEHAFAEEVERLVGNASQARLRVFYTAPLGENVASRPVVARGRLTAADLLDLEAGPEAQYMLCGPAGFLSDLQSGLVASGVPAGNVHYETFGPTG
ncbi:ferredoxin [Roseovarius sp. HI0049]|nr:ferredoxin [Roseovarius sp. HI0049]